MFLSIFYINFFLHLSYLSGKSKPDSRLKPYGITDCNFNSNTNSIKCDLPKLRSRIIPLTSPIIYATDQFVNFVVLGQLECIGSIKEKFGMDCDDFSVAIATGAACENPTSSVFDKLKNPSNYYCKTKSDKFECIEHNAKCPPRKNKSEVCCVLVNCENDLKSCKLKAQVSFSITGYLIASTQNIPMYTEEIVAKGGGFNPESKDILIECLDEKGKSLGCQVKEIKTNSLALTFNQALNAAGPIYGILKNPKNERSGEDVELNKVQIGTVVAISWWEYRFYIAGGVVVVIFVYMMLRKGKANVQQPARVIMPPPGRRPGYY